MTGSREVLMSGWGGGYQRERGCVRVRAWPVRLGGASLLSGTPLSPGVLDQPLESDVCRERGVTSDRDCGCGERNRVCEGKEGVN